MERKGVCARGSRSGAVGLADARVEHHMVRASRTKATREDGDARHGWKEGGEVMFGRRGMHANVTTGCLAEEGQWPGQKRTGYGLIGVER